jgi:phytanoyl-CoA hydroxylase
VSRRTHRFKVNDLYLEYKDIRRLALNARLTPVLKALLGQVPVLCNSLSFLHGSAQPDHVVPEEMSQWSSYMEREVTKRGLEASTFPAKRGDVFIWSAYLLHGGSPILAPERTRKSIVFHSYSEEDSRAQGFNLVGSDGGYWFKRPHQTVPETATA